MYVDYLLCVIECCLKIERNGRMRALDPSHSCISRRNAKMLHRHYALANL